MIKWLPGPAEYQSVWRQMQDFTANRNPDTPDEIWLCEHAPVFTQGLAGKAEHLLDPDVIPVVHSDRGGQVSYHGPGQVLAYSLFDLRRAGVYVKHYVNCLEEAAISTLSDWGIVDACRKPGAPGVYVPDTEHSGLAKIAALGIKVRNGCAYHGVSLNVAMDLRPFQGINPCGYTDVRTVDMAGCGVSATITEVGNTLGRHLAVLLSE